MNKLFVSIPISSIWVWWKARQAAKLAEANEARRERTRRLLADNEGPFPPKGLV